ncbi:hypothetical protein SAMN04487970_1004118 [Paenibacillus tianmuensis]|uniref:Uncharacterized protein n=1 Tax=Paenibacillus tianmuensis TaxID=624147 RepID=A0A1G4PWH8_9BACL|nr:hypothetical protein SAMN04487970_1004118 [Paenibacillus tianmuensis]
MKGLIFSLLIAFGLCSGFVPTILTPGQGPVMVTLDEHGVGH